MVSHSLSRDPQSQIDRDGSFWIILAAGVLWKCIAGAKLGLVFDECYYWVWSLHPQAGYFDHPPLVAWSILAGRSLLGHTELAVRAGAIISGIVLALAGRILAREQFGERAGNRAGILLTLAPVFAGNAFLMTPDTWLAPFWSLAMLFAWKGLEKNSLPWWSASGAAAGIGLLSKYTMILFFAGLALLWISSPGKRGRILGGSLVAGLVALLFFAPVIHWNATHGWSSFAHQIHHGFHNEQDVRIHFDFLGNYALFLLILVSPGLSILCFRSAVERFSDERFRFLAVFFWTVVAFFGYSALKAHIEANWPMIAFVSGLIMIAGAWESYPVVWRRISLAILFLVDGVAVIALSLFLVAGNMALTRLSTKPDTQWILTLTGSTRLSDLVAKNIYELQSKLSELLGPREVAAEVARKFKSSGADFLCANTYQTYGVIAYHQPELEPYLWLPFRGRNRFPWIDDRKWTGKNSLMVEWPGSGCTFFWFFREGGQPVIVLLPGLTKPIFFTLNRGYDPALVNKE